MTSTTEAAAAAAEVWPPLLPATRYVPWESLSEPIRLASQNSLSYIEDTWNLPFSNEAVEFLSFSSLNKKQQKGGSTIGLDEITWDCWVNHYYEYDWSEMVEGQVAECYQALGWSESVWDNSMEELYPETESKLWAELSQDEKIGATCLCFFEDLWDTAITGSLTVDQFTLPTSL